MQTPKEIRMTLAQKFKAVRLDQNMRQVDLAKKSGVTLASLCRFERDGEISLKNLVNLVIALNRAQDFDLLFQLEEEMDLFKKEPTPRKRARL